ncbi:MAG: GTP pyrophosphokinase family protein, partial [Clostridia bacterium]|nr:GTP pyrophosphokinase family protein [Clostridia bacterium]
MAEHLEIEQQKIEKIESAFGEFNKFRYFMMMYNCAIKEVQTKFEILNDELSTMHNRNPIEMIKSRIKSPESIIEKLYRKDFPISMESVLENINDVAGIRVICSFIDDIYEVAHMLSIQDDVKVIDVK